MIENDPASLFFVYLYPTQNFEITIPWKNTTIRVESAGNFADIPGYIFPQLHIAYVNDESAHNTEELLGHELRLTHVPYRSCFTGDTFVTMSDADLRARPYLQKLFSANQMTAIISDVPVDGYDLFIPPKNAVQLIDEFGQRPHGHGFFRKFLLTKDGEYYLELVERAA